MKSSIITRFVATAILTSQSFIGTIALQELALHHQVSPSNYAAQAQEGDRDAAYVYAQAKPATAFNDDSTARRPSSIGFGFNINNGRFGFCINICGISITFLGLGCIVRL